MLITLSKTSVHCVLEHTTHAHSVHTFIVQKIQYKWLFVIVFFHCEVYFWFPGEPPQTSTATLSIYITDENDNLPYLAVNRIDMCLSDKPSLSNITALDLDGDPYSGPFGFNLLGDVKDKWRVEPELGQSLIWQTCTWKRFRLHFHKNVTEVYE